MLFPLQCTISSKATTKDAYGYVSSDYSNVKHTNIPCRIEQLKANELFALANVYPNSRWRIFLDSSINDIALEDQLTIGSTNYYVHAISPCYGAKSIHHYELTCSEITP